MRRKQEGVHLTKLMYAIGVRCISILMVAGPRHFDVATSETGRGTLHRIDALWNIIWSWIAESNTPQLLQLALNPPITAREHVRREPGLWQPGCVTLPYRSSDGDRGVILKETHMWRNCILRTRRHKYTKRGAAVKSNARKRSEAPVVND